jgi:hypothetical protein
MLDPIISTRTRIHQTAAAALPHQEWVHEQHIACSTRRRLDLLHRTFLPP